MLNFRLLNRLLDSRSIRFYLGIAASLGFGVLVDVMVFIKLSLLVGPWITMAALAFLTAALVYVVYRVVDHRTKRLEQVVKTGTFEPDALSRHLSTLVAGLFLIVPGLFNTAVGLILLLKPVGTVLGNRIAWSVGIEWAEAYEHLRLEHVTAGRSSGAEG